MEVDAPRPGPEQRTAAPTRAADAATAVRLVASDLDGTLFGADGQVSERSIRALRGLHEAGVAFVPATGRSHRTAVPRLRPVGTVTEVVCSNGAVVHDLPNDRTVLERPIGADVLDDLVPMLRSRFEGLALAWEVAGDFGWEAEFVERFRAEHREYFLRERSAEIGGAFEDVRPERVSKLMVSHPVLVKNEWLAVLGDVLPDTVTASTSGAEAVELTGAGVDKASTLAMICEARGIDRSEVLAFGDQSNDVAMLGWAGRSVAVANAQGVAVDAADETTAANSEDGVAVVLEQVLESIGSAAG